MTTRSGHARHRSHLAGTPVSGGTSGLGGGAPWPSVPSFPPRVQARATAAATTGAKSFQTGEQIP